MKSGVNVILLFNNRVTFECFSSDHFSTELGAIIARCLSSVLLFLVPQIRHYYYLPFFLSYLSLLSQTLALILFSLKDIS